MSFSGIILTISAALINIFVFAYLMTRRKLREGLKSQSKIIHTALGPVEYADIGNGPVVLHAHGMLGGVDHIRWCRFIADAGFRVILPSRPGYLRTDTAIAKKPEDQAKLYVALLDALGIKRAAVYAVSQGGASALEFALAYPQRCWGLVLMSAFTLPQREFEKILPYVKVFMSLDFLMWLLKPIILPAIMRQAIKALPESERKDDNKILDIRQVFSAAFQSNLRGRGLINDFNNLVHWPGVPLAQVNASTLIIHGSNDTLVPYEHSAAAACTIPGSVFKSVAHSGHELFITRPDSTEQVMLNFLLQHAPRVGQGSSDISPELLAPLWDEVEG